VQISENIKEETMERLMKWLLAGMVLAGLLASSVAVAAPPQVTLEVMCPRGEISHPPYVAPNARATDLAGKKIGLYWNGKPGGNNLLDALESMLKEKFPTATIVRLNGAHQITDSMAADFVKQIDTFAYAVGD
jgi:hypothetical protein